MLTTCPECRTTFRLTQAQLDARRGLVRCGTCRAVFNAYDALLPEFESPAPEAEVAVVMPPSPASGQVTPSVDQARDSFAPPSSGSVAENPERVSGRPEREHFDALSIRVDKAVTTQAGVVAGTSEWGREVAPIPLSDIEDDGVVVHLSGPIKAPVPAFEPPPAMPFESARPEPDSADAILLSELPTREHIEPERHIGRRILSGLVGLILLLTLLAQAAYFLREPILASLPEVRPVVQDACAKLGCRVPSAADEDAIRVESSSLETNPEQPNRASLRVSFSNRSGLVQQWPHVVLKLTDWKGTPLAQRVFKPVDYLPKPEVSGSGMAAGSEQEFRLDLDLGGLSASGYEVLARYP
jgi:predicted Zn finger-like uncharacterized protein